MPTQKPPLNPLGRPLEQAVAAAIVDELTSGSLHVLDRRDLAKRAALAGLREMSDLAARVVGEMAADHERGGDAAGAKALREAVTQIRTLLDDVP